MIIPGATTASGVHMSSGSAASLTVADATAITKECPAVSDVAWAKRQVVQVVYGSQNWATPAQGVPPSYLAVRDWPLSAGRFFDQRDDAGANPVAVLGQTVVDQLFAPGEDPLGAMIRVKNVPFEVIGVLARKGQTAWGQDQDDVILMPFLTAERRVLGTQILGTVDMIVSAAATADVLPKVEPQIRALLRERHRIPAGQDDDFTVRDLNEIAEASKNASAVMMNLLLSVASVSLLVGGIGIMNIMLVSVTERTREIGVRLAVGARSGHILFQFLVEDVPAPRPHREPDADLARALGHRHQHDVHDADATHEERHRGDAEEQVHHHGARVLRGLGDLVEITDGEVVVLARRDAVALAEERADLRLDPGERVGGRGRGDDHVDRAQDLRAEDAPLGGQERHQDHVVLILAPRRLPLAGEHADHREGHVLHADGGADRILARLEELIDDRLPEDRHWIGACLVPLLEEPTRA